MISQEEIYKYLKEENWKELLNIFYKRKDLIRSDTLLQQSLTVTLTVITQKAIELEESPAFIDALEEILQLKAGKFIKLEEKQIELITRAIANGKRENLQYSYLYANKYPEDALCSQIISEYEKKFSDKIKHSLDERLTFAEIKGVNKENDFRKSLFNSSQEVEFFLALKRVFDTYQIYPNVGLSSILKYDSLKEFLSSKERDFFFRSSVDFVVLEPFKNYLPIYFFEVDSVWHDTAEQQERDKMKDKIFAIAGVKLFRIRKLDVTISEVEFERLLREIRSKI